MKIKSYEEFRDYYKRTNNFLLPLKNWSKKELTETQLKSKYRQYCNKIEVINNKKPKRSEHMQKVDRAMREIHKVNDLSYYNNFYSSLQENEKKILDDNMWMCPKTNGNYTFDGCHYVERSDNSKMAYDTDNIVLLPRYLHSCLDNFINPFTQQKLSRKEHHELWESILGTSKIVRLDNKNKN